MSSTDQHSTRSPSPISSRIAAAGCLLTFVGVYTGAMLVLFLLSIPIGLACGLGWNQACGVGLIFVVVFSLCVIPAFGILSARDAFMRKGQASHFQKTLAKRSDMSDLIFTQSFPNLSIEKVLKTRKQLAELANIPSQKVFPNDSLAILLGDSQASLAALRFLITESLGNPFLTNQLLSEIRPSSSVRSFILLLDSNQKTIAALGMKRHQSDSTSHAPETISECEEHIAALIDEAILQAHGETLERNEIDRQRQQILRGIHIEEQSANTTGLIIPDDLYGRIAVGLLSLISVFVSGILLYAAFSLPLRAAVNWLGMALVLLWRAVGVTWFYTATLGIIWSLAAPRRMLSHFKKTATRFFILLFFGFFITLALILLR